MPKKKKAAKPQGKLRISMLGGLYEIGKNLAVIEYGDDIIVVDCGLGFPDDDMLGIDMVIPDITYLIQNEEKIRGIVLTHGHEDHIGALPYVLQQISPPVYGTPLTLGILEVKLEEHTYETKPSLNVVHAGDTIQLGCFEIEFINVNHSIADAVCLAIKTPLGTVIHSGDFKIDLTPIESKMIDLTRLGEYGDEGVLLLMCESTNVERPGYTPSERTVGASLDQIFAKNTDKRISIATFSSNVHRVQQIIYAAEKYGRKVIINGRSMVNIVNVALELGYMRTAENTIIDINDIKKYNPEQLVIVCTGSQGEPMSSLYRMAFSDHSKIELSDNDVVVISANAIPGNEKLVNNIINELFRKGVNVIYDAVVSDVHVSGHACQEELKTMHALTRPKYFMPIHGEYKHLATHKKLAMDMGESPDRIFISEIGKVLEIDADGARWGGTVPSGKILIDGYGVGDVGSIVLRDRRHLSKDGIIVVTAAVSPSEGLLMSGPEIVSRGFIYVREGEEMMDELREITAKVIEDCFDRYEDDFTFIKGKIKDEVSKYIYQKTKRKPMVLPVLLEI
ncbi:MAG: ribonuclease J [Clostridia bacterium]|nr:ribonuclease J [Clostridia bacterium]MBQ3869596.1 ribonuclease J [Clostridia bacterium]